MQIKYEVIWTETAFSDLLGIIEYIDQDSPFIAQEVFDKIRQRAAQLTHLPQRGRIIPELQNQGIILYRELIVSPWRLMYRISEKKVFVVSFLDSRQNVEDILLKRLTL
jgi:toxin ParE1/3/4